MSNEIEDIFLIQNLKFKIYNCDRSELTRPY